MNNKLKSVLVGPKNITVMKYVLVSKQADTLNNSYTFNHNRASFSLKITFNFSLPLDTYTVLG